MFENIKLGKSNATKDKVIEAAKNAEDTKRTLEIVKNGCQKI